MARARGAWSPPTSESNSLRARKPRESFARFKLGVEFEFGDRSSLPIPPPSGLFMKHQPPLHPRTATLSPGPRRAAPLPGLGAPDRAARSFKGAPAFEFDSFEFLHRNGLRQYSQGRNEEALASLSAALRAAPAHAEAWSDLGVVHAATGRLEAALNCYDRAIALDPNHVAALNNTGIALAALGRPQDALASYDRALAVDPGFAPAHSNRGGVLRDLGRLADALASCDRALAIKPDDPDALNNRANALFGLGRVEEALRDYDSTLSFRSNCAKTLNNRGNALIGLGRAQEALASYDQALALTPQSAELHNSRGIALHTLKRFEDAMDSYRVALALTPGNASAQNNLASALVDLGRPADALACYDAALSLNPGYVVAHCNRAQALIELKRPAEALASCDKAIALNPGYADAHRGRGDALFRLNRDEEALASYDRAIALQPRGALAHNNKGLVLLQLGRIAEGGAVLKTAIDLAPQNAQFYHNLARSKRFEPGDPSIPAMETLAGQTSPLDAEQWIHAHFALGKAYADVGDTSRSFHHLALGNTGKRKQSGYDEAQVLGILQRTRCAYTRALMDRHGGQGEASPIPVFIVGMPRSGTTLVEQILASHREVHGAGEINDFGQAMAELGGAAGQALACPEVVRQLSSGQLCQIGASYVRRIRAAAPRARRITNKTTENFRLAGLIALALPDARIVHVRRDPTDTCFSCFSTLFAESIPYVYDLAELGRYYRGYEALMDHWRGLLPQGTMLDVLYEDVVADLEGQARRILAHCGLDWDARCLDFHHHRRSVRTASFAQVRRPLYDSSVGRWRDYEAFLGPLRAALGAGVPTGGALPI